MKAAIYARYSSDMQRQSSIEDQVRNCQTLAQRQGFTVVSIFSDSAISGTTSSRPQYQALLSAASAKQYEVLLVDDLSRLSRDDIEMKTAIRKLIFLGVRIIGISDGFDSQHKGYKIHAGFKSLMNDIFIDDHREKVHRGMSGQALRGYSCGGKPYGYDRDAIYDPTKKDPYGRPAIVGMRYKINEEHAEVVKEIFTWFAEGKSPKWVAGELNRRKTPSPRGSWWRPSSLSSGKKAGMGILNHEIYIGKLVWNRSKKIKNPETGAFTYRMRPESEWITQSVPELQIITSDLWEAVKSKQAARCMPNVMQGNAKKHLFSGLLKCGQCGGNFIIKTRKRYGCATHAQGGVHACANNRTVARAIVETNLLQGIKEDLLQPNAITRFVKRTTELLQERHKPVEQQKKKLQSDLLCVDREIDNILKAIKAGILTPSTKKSLDDAEAAKLSIQHEIEGLRGDAGQNLLKMLPRAVDEYKKLVAKLEEAAATHISEAREIIRTLVGGQIVLLPKGQHLEAVMEGGITNFFKQAAGDYRYYSNATLHPHHSNSTRILLVDQTRGNAPPKAKGGNPHV